ncbi:MAG: hypothetical protein IPL96_04605 [Holophagaceae bacterium]|nr:hypothetical protein [Holophagaceae bacterium]
MNANLPTRPFRFGFALVAGIGLIAAGLLLGLENIGIAVPDQVFRLWPLLLVCFGLARLTQRGPLQRGGHTLVFLGLFFLGLQFEPVKTLRYAPPLGLLWLGVIITLKALLPRPRTHADTAGQPASD